MALDTTPLAPSPSPGSYTHELPRTTINDIIGKAVQDAVSAEAMVQLNNAWTLLATLGDFRSFVFDSSTVAGDPGSGKVRLNNVNPAAATQMYISALTNSGNAFGSLLKKLRINDFGVMNGFNDQAIALLYRLTLAPVDNGTWFTLTIQSEGAQGTFTNGQILATAVYELGAPALKLDRKTAMEYTNAALPPLPTTINTGVDPAAVQAAADTNSVDITVSFQFSGGGNTYALFGQTTAVALLANPLVRISRTGEANGVAGDATMAYWYDNVTQEIVVALDFDGGGKTAVSLSVTSGYNDIIEG